MAVSLLDILKLLSLLGAGYLLGSLNTAVLVGRLYGKDIKTLGSRNAGLTNTLRVLGKAAAVMVLLGDIAKGVLACLIGSWLGASLRIGSEGGLALLIAGAGAVIGHNWPLYFGFKGGKGALTAASVMFVFNWFIALLALGVFVAVIALTRLVSLGTICAVLFFVVLSFLPDFNTSLAFRAISLALASIIVFSHRENIKRLVAGNEGKLSFRRAGR